MKRLRALLLAITIAGAACGSEAPREIIASQPSVEEPAGEDAAAPTTAAPTTTAAPLTTTVPTTAAPVGTHADPYPLGTTAEVGDYTVTVTKLVRDASDVVAAHDATNMPPAHGSVYALVYVDATYNGAGEGHAYWDLFIGYVGADSRVYTDDLCTAWLPDDMAEEPSLVTGGAASGSFCLEVPAAVIGTGQIFVESLHGDRAWWAGT